MLGINSTVSFLIYGICKICFCHHFCLLLFVTHQKSAPKRAVILIRYPEFHSGLHICDSYGVLGFVVGFLGLLGLFVFDS